MKKKRKKQMLSPKSSTSLNKHQKNYKKSKNNFLEGSLIAKNSQKSFSQSITESDKRISNVEPPKVFYFSIKLFKINKNL